MEEEEEEEQREEGQEKEMGNKDKEKDNNVVSSCDNSEEERQRREECQTVETSSPAPCEVTNQVTAWGEERARWGVSTSIVFASWLIIGLSGYFRFLPCFELC